ncbi:hypothetical protein [Streptomyces sp. NPDC058084]|uniref:hypothetical protein n=1 Tax=Streptomyces sp. NPDC058084 TaxID=3346333 RepID=UPI0036EE040F
MGDEHYVGQIFFTHPRGSVVSWAIMYMQGPGPLTSHVGLVVNDGLIYEAIVSRGVVKRPLSVYADGVSYFRISEFEFTAEQRAGLIAASEHDLGAPYGLGQVAKLGASIACGWDIDHGEGNYRLYGDVVATLSILSLPRKGRALRWLIPAYVIMVALGRIRNARERLREVASDMEIESSGEAS